MPAVVDHSPLAGIIPCVRAWYDCGNDYGLSTVTGFGDGSIQVAAGLWLGRRPSRIRRWLARRPIELLHPTPERVHVETEGEVHYLIELVAALPPLWVALPPARLLPDCSYGWCLAHCRPCTRGEPS
jgi:hypothetical protein